MIGLIRSEIKDYLAVAHAITFDFGTPRGSASKIKYYVNLIK